MTPAAPTGTATTVDAVIIGAGVIGTSIALELSRAGYRTLNVDRVRAAGHGSTSASAGILRTYAASRDAVALAAEAMTAWRDWADYLELPAGTPVAAVRPCSTLVLDPYSDYIDRVTVNLRELGLPYELWSDTDLRAAVPWLDARRFGPPRSVEDPAFWADPEGSVAPALHLNDSAWVPDPVLATENLKVAAQHHGARFRFAVDVVAIETALGRASGVRFADGTTVSAPVVINAAGPDSARVNALAGADADMRVRTRAVRHELHHLPCPPELDYTGNGLHVADADLGINFRPETGNAVLVGGNGAGCDPVEYVDDPDSFRPTVTRERWDTYSLRVSRRIRGLRVPSRPSGVAGLYDVSDDWMPIYDRSALPGFYMAVGTSGNQFKTAPVVGRLMAALVDACENGRDHDHDPVDLATSSGPIRVGAYSRLRESAAAVTSVNG